MLRKLSLRSVLFFVVSLACFVNCAPVNDRLSRSLEGVKLSHISRGDVELLKKQLQELEEDLTALEPAIPTEVTLVEDEGDENDDDLELADEGDNDKEEDIEEDVPVSGSLSYDKGTLLQSVESGVADNIRPLPADSKIDQAIHSTAPENQAAVEDDLSTFPETEQDVVNTDAEDQAVVDGSDITVVKPLLDTVEEDDGERWEEGEFVPYREPIEEDLYLQRLILKALTVLYRKDVDRIDRMMWNYYHNLGHGDDELLFPDNAQPLPQALAPNPDNVKEQGDDENVEAAAGLFNEAPVAHDGKWQEGVIKEGVIDEIGNDVEIPNNRKPIADTKPVPTEDKVPEVPGVLEPDVEVAEEAVNGQVRNVEADELLAELMAGIHTSLQNFNDQKAQLGRNE